jgi:hypothetical protein
MGEVDEVDEVGGGVYNVITMMHHLNLQPSTSIIITLTHPLVWLRSCIVVITSATLDIKIS